MSLNVFITHYKKYPVASNRAWFLRNGVPKLANWPSGVFERCPHPLLSFVSNVVSFMVVLYLYWLVTQWLIRNKYLGTAHTASINISQTLSGEIRERIVQLGPGISSNPSPKDWTKD